MERTIRRYRSDRELSRCGRFEYGRYCSRWYRGLGGGMEWLRLSLTVSGPVLVRVYAADGEPDGPADGMEPVLERPAEDLLLCGVKGRFLCFTAEPGECLRSYELTFPGLSIDSLLPSAMQGDGTLRKLLGVYQSLYMDLNRELAGFPARLDPLGPAPLPELARWLGASSWMDQGLPEPALLAAAAELNRQRGTKQGLRRLAKLVTGHSVIGEAFDPAALAYVGNDFCARYHISAKCEACPFVSGSQNVLQSLDDDRSVVLVPYFRTGNFSPGRNPLKEKRAHWSAIDTVKRGGSTTYDLYEGNWHGSISSPRLFGLPLPVTPEELINSNGDIQSEFDWNAFLAAVQVRQGSRSDAPILTGLDAVNEHKKNVVVNQAAANSGPFRDLEAYREQIRLVMDSIGCLPSPIRRSTVSGSGGPLLQPMSLAGAVVIVKHS